MRNLYVLDRLRFCVIIAVLVGCFPLSAFAQSVIAVPFDTAALSWGVPTPDATHTAPASHLVTCGASTLSVPMPATSVLVSAVVASPGTYACTVAAVNSFGVSAAVAFPQFEAGYPPLSPTNPHIVIP